MTAPTPSSGAPEGTAEAKSRARKHALKAIRSAQPAELREEVARFAEQSPRLWALSRPEGQAALERLAVEGYEAPIRQVRSCGDPRTFRVQGGLVRSTIDWPASGAVDDFLSASWGELRVTVNERTITMHDGVGQAQSGVRWYLLPFLEWLIRDWQPLFGLALTTSAPDEPTVHDWRQSGHGTPLPPLALSRWVHRVTAEWSPAAYSAPKMVFSATGTAHIDPVSMSDALREWALRIARDLAKLTGSPRARSLIEQLTSLPPVEKDIGQRVAKSPLPRAAIQVLNGRGVEQSHPLLLTQNAGLQDVAPGPLRLLFGSSAPTIDEHDVNVLTDASFAASATSQRRGLLASIRRARPIVSNRPPWRQGQELALDALIALDCMPSGAEAVDIRGALARLEVEVRSIQLNDEGVRGFVVGAPGRQPIVYLNRRNRRNRKEMSRRFALAHELCHILYDAGFSTALGIADGPWAPEGLEQRANAFAAMFLMPPELIKHIRQTLADDLDRRGEANAVAAVARTSPMAAMEHLSNLDRTWWADADASPLSAAKAPNFTRA
jgi:IrrE N-terminal-like domain